MRKIIIAAKGDSAALVDGLLVKHEDAVVWSLNDRVHARAVEHWEVHWPLEQLPRVPVGCKLWIHPGARGMTMGREDLRDVGCVPVGGSYGLLRWDGVREVSKVANTVCLMLMRVVELQAEALQAERGRRVWRNPYRIGCVWLAGVDLLADRRERVTEVEGVLYWCGVLNGLGVQVCVPDGSVLAIEMTYPSVREWGVMV